MGTPEFAVEPLRCLVEGGYNVVGVVTMPDKAVGRHHDVLTQSAVKQYAVARGLPVLQPVKLKDEAFLAELRALRADLQIVVAFRMLPEVVWAMPPLGTFNLHAALLPQYRGAAPINWAVINGDEQTGLTTFFLDHDIDTGRIIRRVAVPIRPTDNAGDVHDRLMMLGGRVVCDTVDDILHGDVQSLPQSEIAVDGELRPAPKLFKETCRISWQRPARDIHNFVRGLSPYPAAWTELVSGTWRATLKVYETEIAAATPSAAPGTVGIDAQKGEMWVALSDARLMLREIQLAGKKRMRTADFLRGFRAPGDELRVE